jgi:DHA3 family tetracycline resistance protein-like MFS transporter
MLAPARVYLIAVAGYEFLFALWATSAVVRRVTTLGFDPLELVLVGTALELSVFALEVPTGAVADTWSRRVSVAIGYALVGLGFAFEALAGGFALVVAAQLVWGGGWTFISGAREAWIADEVGEADAARLYLRGTQLGLGATLLGLALGVILATWDLRLPMLLGGGSLVVLALWLGVTMREPGFRPSQARGWRAFAGTLAGGVRAVRGRPILVMLMVVAVLTGASSEGIDRLREYHMLHGFDFPELQPVHLFGALNAAGLLAGLGLVSWLRRHVDPARAAVMPRLLAFAYALMIAALLTFALTESFVVVFAAWCVFTAVRRAGDPFITAWLNHRLDSSVRATVMSLHGQSDALGQTSGGPLLGLLARQFAVRAALVGAAAFLVPALALFFREARREHAP